jgi:PST family polysaccharide transporter
MPAEPQAPNVLSVDHMQADLRGLSIRGALVTLTSQGAQFLIQCVSTVVLARLLIPADFGLVAMVSAITGLCSAFSDFGLSEATIQRKEITHDQVSTLFWINAAIGLSLTLITAALAPVLAAFYREPRLVAVGLVSSLSFLLGGLRVQADALFKRQMRLSSLAARDIASYAVGVIVAITMAMHGAGYWALVALPLSLSLTQTTLSWLMLDWRPSLPRRNTKVGAMVAFGGKVSASYLMVNIDRCADNILIGWHAGAGPLGLYSRAYNLLMLPVRQLSGPATSVAVPAFSRLQGDPERFARYYLRAIGLIMWMATPIFGFLFVAANPVIVLILGSKWEAAAPLFQILVISAIVQLLIESTLWIFVSRGQSGRLLKLLAIISPIIIAGFAIGLPFGVKGVALSGSLAWLGILPWTLKFSFRGTNLTLPRVGRALVYPIASCFVGVFFSRLALHLFRPEHIPSQLFVVGLGFVAAYSIWTLIPPIRDEVMSFKELLGELRLSSFTG